MGGEPLCVGAQNDYSSKLCDELGGQLRVLQVSPCPHNRQKSSKLLLVFTRAWWTVKRCGLSFTSQQRQCEMRCP